MAGGEPNQAVANTSTMDSEQGSDTSERTHFFQLQQELDRSMEHKTWIRWSKSSEKMTIASKKSDLSLVGNEQEKEKAIKLERSLKELKEQLSSAHTESNAKDDILAKQVKVAEEAIAGWEKAEAEAESFKHELDDALHQKVADEERMVNIDAALKECMRQLRVVKEEHQHIVNDATTKILREQEKARALEKRLAEANNRLAKLGVENSNLCRILEVKEKLIEDLRESKSQSEANFTAILARLDFSEKDNASLKYEVCMLQKELELRNLDRDFHLKSADAAHKQHLESIKKITKLESECQRLRVMVRKRLPGPAAIAKMRSEVEMLRGSTIETWRKKPNSAMGGIMLRNFVSENGYDASSKRVASLIERLHAIEDEKKILKDALVKKNSELQSSRIMFARTVSKLSQAEIQLEELSKGQICIELARNSPLSYDPPLASIPEDGGNEDTLSCAESWASALISELEHFRNGKPTTPSSRTAGVSELSLMDDFIEMEKLAIVCVDRPSGSSNVDSGERITCVAYKETDSKPDPSESTGKELVPVDSLSDFSETNHEIQSSYISFEKHPSWLQDILRVIMQKHHIVQRSLDVILEEVSVALGKRHPSIKGNPSDSLCVSGNISQKVVHTSSDSLDGAFGTPTLQNETSKQLFQSNLEKYLCKLIELTEGIIQRSITSNSGQQILAGTDGSNSPLHKYSSPTGHVAHVLLWEISEFTAVLQHFIGVCNDLLHGKADLEKFARELASTLDWIINHCFSLQDVSTMKETIKKLFDGNKSHRDNEFETAINSLGTEEDKTDASEEVKFRIGSSLPLSATSNGQYILSRMEEIETKLKDENRRLRHAIRNMESRKKDLEERLESANAKNESLITQLKESGESISNLQVELATVRDSKGLIEDQIENQRLITEVLGTQLTVAKAELNEAHQKFSSLEVELEDKSNCYEELEATCLELQLQLESVAAKETPKYDKGQEEKQLRTDRETSATSEKLAECQATILNLGKQLKALAAPKDAVLFDQVMSSPSSARVNRRPKLIDQMHAEYEARFEHLKSPKTKEICTEPKQPPTSTNSENDPNVGLLYGWKICTDTSHGANNSMVSINKPSMVKSPGSFHKSDESDKQKDETDVGRLVFLPRREKGGLSLLRKLLSRRKKESSKKLVLPICS